MIVKGILIILIITLIIVVSIEAHAERDLDTLLKMQEELCGGSGMNKYEETLNELRQISASERQNKLYDILQELVDKEIPMKPIVEIYRGREVIGCGVCGEVAMDEYCTGCGQRIDWREET